MSGSIRSAAGDSEKSTVIVGDQENLQHDDEEEEEDEEGEEDEGPKKPVEPAELTLQEKIDEMLAKAKFYTSLCMGTSAILSVFAFLFLIPFVVEPSITALLADFEPEPVTCAVSELTYVEGMKNCSWASCREGCTTSHTRCYQILVNYSLMPYSQYVTSKVDLDDMEWEVTDTKYLINTEGCGYPPRVNCTEFAGNVSLKFKARVAFPCYYSKVHPERVVERYEKEATLQRLIIAIVAPPVAFVFTIGVLVYWHCPRRDQQRRPSKEDKLLCDDLDLEEPEDALYCRERSGSRDTDALWKG